MKSSGINIIDYQWEEKDGVITKFTINQGMYKFGENRLRKQKFQIALFDEEMNLIQVVDALTDDKVA